MSWYYARGTQQAGPVEEQELKRLVTSGELPPTSLVWTTGMADWKPYEQVFGGAAGGSAAGASVVCAECGKTFRLDEVITLAGRAVCAACKPALLQRVSEGVAPLGAGTTGSAGAATLEEVRERDYEHDLGGYFSKAWEMFKADPWLIMGATVLVYLCLGAASAIPYLSAILQLIFSGPLMGGLWYFYLRKLRGQPATVGDAFSGFGPKFGQLLLAYLIPNLIAMAIMIPVAIVIVVGIMISSQGGGDPSMLLIIPGVLLGAAALCAIIYYQTCWMLAVPLVIDKGMSFWPAMGLSRAVVRKHWWMTFLILIVTGLFAFVGLFACCVGVALTGSVAFAVFAQMYERTLGDLAPQPGG